MKYLKKFFLGSILSLFIYLHNIFNFYIDLNFDTFEYLGHTNTIINYGEIKQLASTRFGTTGKFPIYSKFPGVFINLSDLSLISGLSSGASLIVYSILFRIFLYLTLYLISLKIFQTSPGFKNSKILNFGIVFTLLITFLLPYLHFSTQLQNIYFFLVGSYLIIKNKKLFFGLLFYYATLLFHHQSLVMLAPIMLVIVSSYLFTNKKSTNDLFGLIFIVLMGSIHFLWFLLPDIDSLLKMGKSVAGDTIYKSRNTILLFKHNYIWIIFVYLGILRKKNIHILLVYSYMTIFAVLPYFFPERFYAYLIMFSIPLLSIELLEKINRKGIYVILFLVIIILNSFDRSYIIKHNGFYKKRTQIETLQFSLIDYHSYSKGLLESIGFFKLAGSLRTVVGDDCVLGDIFYGFNFNNAANIKSCYGFERPINPNTYKIYKDYEKYTLLDVYTKYNNVEGIAETLKKSNIKYIGFNDIYINYNSLSSLQAFQMKQIFTSLNKINSKFEIVGIVSFRESNFYLYRVK